MHSGHLAQCTLEQRMSKLASIALDTVNSSNSKARTCAEQD